MKSKQITPRIRYLFLINMWLYVIACVFATIVGIFTILFAIIPSDIVVEYLSITKSLYFASIADIVLFICAFGMAISLNINIKNINKENKENFLFYFFKGINKHFDMWSDRWVRSWNVWCVRLAFIAIFFQDLMLVTYTFVDWNDGYNIFDLTYAFFWIATNINVIVTIALSIIANKKYEKIYGKKIKSLK